MNMKAKKNTCWHKKIDSKTRGEANNSKRMEYHMVDVWSHTKAKNG